MIAISFVNCPCGDSFDEVAGWPPLCKAPGCVNSACRRLESPYCHPHTLLLMIHTGLNEQLARTEIAEWVRTVAPHAAT